MENKFVQYPEIGKKYYHYKGGTYEVLTMAEHTETKEALVIYKSILFGTIFARPISQWFEKVVDKDGHEVSRFWEPIFFWGQNSSQ